MDADGPVGVRLGLANPFEIVGADAWVPDHIPGGHVLVAAVHRIAEIALDNVLQEKTREEGSKRNIRGGEAAFLDLGEDVVLLRRGKLRERLLQALLTQAVDRLDAQPVLLLRRKRGLVAEFRLRVEERTLHVPNRAVGPRRA